MHILIVTGGTIDQGFIDSYLQKYSFDEVIGVDKGLEYLYHNNIRPTDIVGDFDSLQSNILACYEKQTEVKRHVYDPVKDATDTEIAVRLALTKKPQEITIIGGTGSRLDHTIGNIQILSIALQEDIICRLVDGHNRIRLLNRTTMIKKEQVFGRYVSLLPLTTEVSGLTLRGFKYPLNKHLLTSTDSLGISNELTEDQGIIEFEEGILVMIEASDEMIV